MGLRPAHPWLIGALALPALLGAGAAAPQAPFPRLANVYLSGSVDDEIITALARWDVVVLSETWTPAQLQRLRTLNPSGLVGLDLFVDTPGSVWLDDVSLRAGDTALFRRDFEHGVVLLNYTTRTQTVDLETTYHRLQLPASAVFDGAAVRRETIPPSDARILLRASPSDVLEPPAALLLANRPNPFNPGTEISFTLRAPARVRLAVFEVTGRLLRVLLDEDLPGATPHRIAWDGRDARGERMPSGVYLYELRSG
ncbi:MAG: hypothetical protein OEO21_13520, partial [Candidatus Krumholzibacteria bacterium]|nr:hypothetical protein [Candidatus Krumholzibacteria bacterium]